MVGVGVSASLPISRIDGEVAAGVGAMAGAVAGCHVDDLALRAADRWTPAEARSSERMPNVRLKSLALPWGLLRRHGIAAPAGISDIR
jgi:hypothetical protein